MYCLPQMLKSKFYEIAFFGTCTKGLGVTDMCSNSLLQYCYCSNFSLLCKWGAWCIKVCISCSFYFYYAQKFVQNVIIFRMSCKKIFVLDPNHEINIWRAKNNFLELVSLNISNYSIKKLATIDYYGYSKQGVVHIPILNHVFAEKVKAKKHN